MLSEQDKEKLYSMRLLNVLHDSEIEFIDYILKHNELPDYSDNNRMYRVYLRLRKKYAQSKTKAHVLNDLLSIADGLTVSNKSIGGDID